MIDELLATARDAAGDATAALSLAEKFGGSLPFPGEGDTRARWRTFTELAAVDLTVARVFEAHADALAILHEAGEQPPTGTWGVFAAEAHGVRLEARADGDTADATVRLYGTKPWCSLAGVLDHALVTAHDGEERRLYAVDLRQPSVSVAAPSGWVARGLSAVPSGPVDFDGTPARPIGPPGWYFTRPGFAWGGIGVAACWLGGARALGDRLTREAVRRAHSSDAFAYAMHAGAADVLLHAADACLDAAAAQVDAGAANATAGELLALRVRSLVAHTAEEAVARCGHALGPAPLAFDEEHARRVADLQLYVRQHHAERDLATLGRLLIDETTR